MSVLVILIIAAILHASWNAFVKDQNNGLVTVTIISSTMALLVLPLTFVVGLPSSEIWIYLLISVIAHTLYLHAMTRAYSLYDFSIAYPFARGLAPLITVLILIIFFNAEVDMFEFIGILLIVSAILLLLPKKISEIGFKNILSMLYFPLAITFYTIVDAEGIQHANNPYQYIVWIFIFSSIPLLTYNLIFNKDNLINTLKDSHICFVGHVDKIDDDFISGHAYCFSNNQNDIYLIDPQNKDYTMTLCNNNNECQNVMNKGLQ